MKKVLVTGATGFIGRHVLEVLISRGIYEVHAVTLDVPLLNSQGVSWHAADLLDGGQIDKLMRDVQPDFLMHFAWYAVPRQYWASEKNMVWEKASIELVKRFYENGGQRMVGAGTCAEYAWGSDVLSEKETSLQPATLYGQCKLRVGTFLREYCKKHDKGGAWGRIFFLYGPYEDSRRLVPSVICSLLQNKPALCTHGEQIRDFLYVKDVALAFVALLESNVIGAVNIASGQPIILKNIIFEIADVLNMRKFVQLGALPASQSDPRVLVPDVRRLTEEIKWRPEVNLNIGLNQTIKWWKKTLHV